MKCELYLSACSLLTEIVNREWQRAWRIEHRVADGSWMLEEGRGKREEGITKVKISPTGSQMYLGRISHCRGRIKPRKVV
jgi:hypothetical protein